MDSGWIKLYRKLLDWEWFNDSKTLHVFIYLLLKANHKDKKWRGETIKRGQVLTGRMRIAEDTGLSERKVRTAISNLISTSEVTSKATSKYSIITICNYDDFQQNENANDQQNDQVSDQQTPSKRPQPRIKELKKEPTTTLSEVLKIYKDVYRDMLPSKTVIDELQRLIDEYDGDEIKEAFIAASSAKAKSLTFVTNGLKARANKKVQAESQALHQVENSEQVENIFRMVAEARAEQ